MNPSGRLSGIQLPLFSLRSRQDFGVGDFGGASGLFEWMKRAEQRMWMLLPLLPTAPGDASPYSTRSAFGLNPLFIDLARLPELQEGGTSALSAPERDQLQAARTSKRIRYDLVFPLKGAALRRAFERFTQEHWKPRSERARALEAYQQAQADWLLDFSTFTAVSRDQQFRAWWEWPEALRHRDPQALAAERARLSEEILFQDWQQWVAETQWEEVRKEARAAGILLCGDEPFIISQDSADVWAYPNLLRRDAKLGVPPDDFSATGQDWGLPYFDLEAMEKEDWRWLKFRARKSASYYDLRRVDHAVGYFRQWIRDEKTPTGRFIPADEKLHPGLGERIFQLLSKDAGIIAEDLGVIPRFVRETLSRLGIPGYRVLRWERDDGRYRNPHEFPPSSLVTTGTHDTEPLRDWWLAASEHERKNLAEAYPEFAALRPPPAEFTPAVHLAHLAAAESSGSTLCLLPWQDVLGTSERINLPGTMSDSNWAYRMDQSVETLLERPETRAAAELLARLTREGRRTP
jgi:4-alpha-glucanotransferase